MSLRDVRFANPAPALSPASSHDCRAIRAAKLTAYLWYTGLGGCLLLIWLGFGGCTGTQEVVNKPVHYFDKTDVDLEQGPQEPATRYRRPRGVQAYNHDETTVDLSVPRASLDEPSSPGPPPTTPSSPSAPLPGGDR